MPKLNEIQREALWVLWMSSADDQPVRTEYHHHTLKRLQRFGFLKIIGPHEVRPGLVVVVTPEGITAAKAINDEMFGKKGVSDVVDESEG